MTSIGDQPIAVVVARAGELPLGATEAIAEADGRVLVVGDGAGPVAESVPTARQSWWADTGPGLQAGQLAAALAPLLELVPLVLLPASADGRDLAPRLAAELDRPKLAHALAVAHDAKAGLVHAQLARLDDRLTLAVEAPAPVVATLVPGVRSVTDEPYREPPVALGHLGGSDRADVEVVEVLEPDPATMDLADASRVVGGGAGLAPRSAGDDVIHAVFRLMTDVANTLGASAGATRVVTDAGWMDYNRQVGTTGVTIDPDLYIAFGVAGATQHIGGLGAPRHIVSVNTDPSSPMTEMADLGLVTDARGLLVELAGRLGLDVPEEVRDA